MKNVKRIVSAVLCILMLLSAFPLIGFAENVASYYGDVNKDGNITSSDARTILRVAAMLETFSDEDFKVADVNQDGNISSSDARKTLRVAAMLDPKVEIENKGTEESEKDILEKISTFVPYDEFAEKYEMGDITVLKNLTNNIIITDERTDRTPLKIEATYMAEGEYKNCYSISITIENTDKTYEIISDNKYVIIFDIVDFGAVALKYLDYTHVDNLVIDEEDGNVEMVGFWLDFDGEITFPERESVPVTEDNIKNVIAFKEYEGTDEAKEDYPDAQFLLNDTQNIIIIDQRSNKNPLDIGCTIGLDEWDEEDPVFKIVVNTKTSDEEKICDFEVGEKSFAVVNIFDDGYSAFSSDFGTAEDYVKL